MDNFSKFVRFVFTFGLKTAILLYVRTKRRKLPVELAKPSRIMEIDIKKGGTIP